MANKNQIDNNKKYIRLSYTLSEDSLVHIGLKQPKILPINRISEGDDYNTSILTVQNHCGTHIDAPAHFIEEGRPISDFGPEELTFGNIIVLKSIKSPGELVDVSDVSKISDKKMDCLILCTDFYTYHNTEPRVYLEENPGISPEAVYYLRENFSDLRMIGIDSVSMSRYGYPDESVKVHQTAFMENEDFGKPLLFVEDMDLSPLDENMDIKELIVVPWQVAGLDGAPCTVLAQFR